MLNKVVDPAALNQDMDHGTTIYCVRVVDELLALVKISQDHIRLLSR